jgi:antitoxin MazE
MIGVFRKWGNSLGIRIPRGVAEQAGVEEGTQVEIKTEQGRIVITPAVPRYTLEELLKGISNRNLHGEIDLGASQGKETW